MESITNEKEAKFDEMLNKLVEHMKNPAVPKPEYSPEEFEAFKKWAAMQVNVKAVRIMRLGIL